MQPRARPEAWCGQGTTPAQPHPLLTWARLPICAGCPVPPRPRCGSGPVAPRVFSPPLPPAVMNGGHSPTAVNGAPSTPSGFSNGPATSSTASLSTQHLPPACGARQLSKLKRFLTTLQQFGTDISPEIGERVRTLVLGLVVSGAAGRAAGCGALPGARADWGRVSPPRTPRLPSRSSTPSFRRPPTSLCVPSSSPS